MTTFGMAFRMNNHEVSLIMVEGHVDKNGEMEQ